MNNGTARRLNSAGILGAMAVMMVGVGVSAGMAGCQGGGGLGGMFEKSAMEMLTPALKNAANSYIGSLGSLADAMKSVKGYQDAIGLVEKVQPMIKQASSAYQTLSATSGADRANLIKAFGPEFKSANSGFTSQLDALKGNSSWGQLVSTGLERVKMFE